MIKHNIENIINGNKKKLLTVRPSFWKILMYLEISLIFTIAGIGLLLLPASQIHPTPLSPEPPIIVRFYGIATVLLGLAGIYVVIRFAKKIVLSINQTEIYYPREHYKIAITDIKRARCYRYYIVRGMQARMIVIWVKNPDKYTKLAPSISRLGAEMLKADLYLNLALASDKSFEKVCRTLKNIGITVDYADYRKHSLKTLRKEWGDLPGFLAWWMERSSVETDLILFTLMTIVFVWIAMHPLYNSLSTLLSLVHNAI